MRRFGELVCLLYLGSSFLGEALELRVPYYATSFAYEGSKFRRDGQWLALRDPGDRDSVSTVFDLADGVYDVTLFTVGENDGRPPYEVHVNDRLVGEFRPPLASKTTEEGEAFRVTWEDVEISRGDEIRVTASTDTENGSDTAWGCWSRIVFSRPFEPTGETAVLPTIEAGIYGELKKWHRVTLAFVGPDVSERSEPNPFTDFRLNVRFRHAASGKEVWVPGYYAADGFAGETGGESGAIWRVHFCPDEAGLWRWESSFRQGQNIAMFEGDEYSEGVYFDGEQGSFEVADTDKTGRDFRGMGTLRYTGERYFRFAGSGGPFIKGGADSPENFLAYEDFDGAKPVHANLNQERAGEAPEAPLHRYEPHSGDWKEGDPTWRGGKGKNIIGVLNYLAGKE